VVLIVAKGAGVPMSLALWMTLSAHLADVLSVIVALLQQREVSDIGTMDRLLLGINVKKYYGLPILKQRLYHCLNFVGLLTIGRE
jgi:hypothetical protein